MASLRALLAIALLAGCLHAPPPDPEAEPEAIGSRLELTDCVGWDALSPPLPSRMVPVQGPQGWTDDPDGQAIVLMGGYDCQRVAVGPFERGPVRIVYDASTRFVVPESCKVGPQEHRVLALASSVWVDDPDIALYLRDTYGMPTHTAPVAAATDALGPRTRHAWTWGPPGTPSTLSVEDLGSDAVVITPTLFFWARGDGVGSLLVTLEPRPAPSAERPAYGTLAPPMILAGMPGGLFAGYGAWYSGFSTEGAFALFSDGQCTVPEA